jgi:hypothetical protein
MRLVCFVAATFMAAWVAGAWQASPKFTAVEPETGKAGAEFVVKGENLTKDMVGEVYLTDGKNDSKCQIMDQQAQTIKIKAAGDVKPGRYSLMILTGDKSRFIEQPVKVNIE